MKRICLPAWVFYIIGIVAILGAIYGAYAYGWNKGDDSYACMPDVNFDTYYMECFNASFASGVLCPCSGDLQNVHTCLDILDNNAFTQTEKQKKVEEAFGTNWAQLIPVRENMIVECSGMGVCPAGACVTKDGACTARAEDYGESSDKCCLAVIPASE